MLPILQRVLLNRNAGSLFSWLALFRLSLRNGEYGTRSGPKYGRFAYEIPVMT